MSRVDAMRSSPDAQPGQPAGSPPFSVHDQTDPGLYSTIWVNIGTLTVCQEELFQGLGELQAKGGKDAT